MISFIPASYPAILKLSCACPVTPTIEGYLSGGNRSSRFKYLLICLVASMPSMIGMLKSVNISLYSIPFSIYLITVSTASFPWRQKSIYFLVMPNWNRSIFMVDMQNSSSSTTIILFFFEFSDKASVSY